MPTPETENLENLDTETVTDETETQETEATDNATEEDNAESEDQDTVEDPKATRHAQQMEWARKEVQRLREIAVTTAVRAASLDPQSLVDLHKSDPKLAKEVASNLDFTQTERWTFENFLKGKKWSDDEDKESYYQRRRAEEIHSEALDRATKLIDKIKDEDLREKAKAKFDKISDWKRLTYDDAEEFAEMAISFVWAKNNVDSKERAAAKAVSTTVWKSNKNSSENEWPYIDFKTRKLVYPTKN